MPPSSVNFTVYFSVESEQANVLKVSDKVATGIKYALDDAGIDMPYPHNVVLFHDATGTRDGDKEHPAYSESQSPVRPEWRLVYQAAQLAAGASFTTEV
ncbi:MAG TPA: hypothetical protein VFZ23_02630 [Pyrinomonadaceae bacterium]